MLGRLYVASGVLHSRIPVPNHPEQILAVSLDIYIVECVGHVIPKCFSQVYKSFELLTWPNAF